MVAVNERPVCYCFVQHALLCSVVKSVITEARFPGFVQGSVSKTQYQNVEEPFQRPKCGKHGAAETCTTGPVALSPTERLQQLEESSD